MKVDAPKKEDREAKKWAEHMGKKAGRGKEAGTEKDSEVMLPQKKKSIEGKKIEKQIESKKEAQKSEAHGTTTGKKEEKKTTVKAAGGSGGAGQQKAGGFFGATGSEKGKKSVVEIEAELEDLAILRHPLVTEKAVNMIDAENKITFVVDSKATKPLVKKAVESLYKVKVLNVNILRDMKARKRAIVTLQKQFKAGDLATKLGVI